MSTTKKTIRAYELDGAWGVEEISPGPQQYYKGIPIQKDYVIYESMFSEGAAKRIAQLLRRKKPPEDWEATKDILLTEGFTDATINAPESEQK